MKCKLQFKGLSRLRNNWEKKECEKLEENIELWSKIYKANNWILFRHKILKNHNKVFFRCLVKHIWNLIKIKKIKDSFHVIRRSMKGEVQWWANYL